MNSLRGSMPVLILCALIMGGLNALASTLTVTSLADSGPGTLRDQVAAAAPGDIINFSVTGTISLTNAGIAIARNLTIIGPGVDSLTVKGQRNSGVSHYDFSLFTISNGIVGISGLTLMDGQGTDVLDGSSQTYYGGGIYITGGTVTVAGCTFTNNSTQYGGAVYMAAGSLSVESSVFSGNDAFYGGGAIGNGGGTLTVTSSTISGNTAGTGGGISSGGTATIRDSTISGNTANGNQAVVFGVGGGIFNYGSSMTVVNCTISGNSALLVDGPASIGGGGVMNQGDILTISNSTITLNSGKYGGGIKVNTGTLNLFNSIVASNSASDGPDIYGNVTSSGYNITGQDPKLGPLADNGGPTRTHAVLIGSPAVDAGDPNFDATGIPYDQRGPGFPRVQNGRLCIGAFEQAPNQSGSSVIVNTLADHDYGTCGPSDGSLREAIKYASPGATITFGVTGTITLTQGELASINKDLTIIGPTNAPGITVSGNNANRIFTVTRTTNNLPTTAVFSTLTLSGGDGVGSIGTGNGGAIYIDTFTPPLIVTVTNCALSHNSATGNGGAIRNGGTLAVTSSTFSSNTSTNNGGAIVSPSPLTLTVANSTFSGNTATTGGAIRSGGTLTMMNNTISSNTATTSGGGIEFPLGTSSLSNNIVAGNSAPTGSDINGSVTSGDYNLVQNPAGATLPDGHNITGQPALLGPLANNGGFTQTHALLPGSPAINAGNTTVGEDQRGVSRPQGTADDIGAFELEPHRPTLSIRATPLSQVEICWDTVTNVSYQLQYRSTLTTNQWSPLSAWIVGGGQTICTNDSVSQPQRFYQVGVTNSP